MIEKTANKFAKALKNDITFHNAKNYVERQLGYHVLYIGTPDGNREMQRYSLTDYKDKLAFSYTADTCNLIFISNTLSEDEKLLYLLHECGHILANHINMDANEIDSTRAEKEANEFAYTVLLVGSRKQKTRYKGPFCISFVLAVMFMVLTAVLVFCDPPKVSQTLSRSAFTNASSGTEEADDNVVYVTPHGQKYHVPSCRYVKGRNDIIAISPEEASKYDPCKVCNPPLFW